MEFKNEDKTFFTRYLLEWHYTKNDRTLPWKQERDPYRIWLSEVILQQTRALQGLPYYLKFTEAYPTVGELAAAKDEDVFRIWQGLGYYNRCKNMLVTAKLVTQEWRGKFPSSYDGLISLKGIGPYTAAAIASFAFDLPHAVVDGNVYRVLARYFGISDPCDTTNGKVIFQNLAQELLDEKNSAAYNQAIMDLGATVCTPRNPNCLDCPLQKKCQARRHDMIQLLPVKSKKLDVKERFFHYVLFISGNNIWIRKRTEKDIWENLYEPYLIEDNGVLDVNSVIRHEQFKHLGISEGSVKTAGKLVQRLTHRIIKTSFFVVALDGLIEINRDGGQWIPLSERNNFAFPKTVTHFLEKKLYF